MGATGRLLRLAFLACALATGAAVIRNCTDTLTGIEHLVAPWPTPWAARHPAPGDPPVQPAR